MNQADYTQDEGSGLGSEQEIRRQQQYNRDLDDVSERQIEEDDVTVSLMNT